LRGFIEVSFRGSTDNKKPACVATGGLGMGRDCP
jgi:hypothetical protein